VLLALLDKHIFLCYAGGRTRYVHTVKGSVAGHHGKKLHSIAAKRLSLYRCSSVNASSDDRATYDHSASIGPYQILSYNDDLLLQEDNDDLPADNTIRLVDIRSGWGNGAHPTTKLCLDFVLNKVSKDDLFLDYGCGSGILSILAAKLGASQCISVDIDEDSLSATRTNAALNGVVDVLQVVHTKEVYIGEGRQRLADVTVANILPGPLSRLGTY